MSFQSIQNIPNRNDSDQVWINWYKDLRSTLGAKKANDIFSRAWSAQNASDSDANTTYLREEMEKYGIDISGGFLGESLDFGRQVTGYFGDMFTAGKWLSIGMGVVIVGSLGLFLYQLATKPEVRKEAGEIGALIGTRGMSKLK